MKKSILFKRTRESIIRKLSIPYIRENLEYFGYMFSILFIAKYNYPKLQSKNGQCCMSVLDNVAKYWISGS